MAVTKISDLINPQVMADIISGKVSKKIVVSPFAKIDTTLQGQAGDKVTVPAFAYIGDAVDVAEGDSVTASKLQASSTSFGIKKAMKAVTLTDEAVLLDTEIRLVKQPHSLQRLLHQRLTLMLWMH
jgi:hypothetical protein